MRLRFLEADRTRSDAPGKSAGYREGASPSKQATIQRRGWEKLAKLRGDLNKASAKKMKRRTFLLVLSSSRRTSFLAR